MDSFIQDIRYAVRSLRKARGTTAVAVLCLALGIGANTAIFSVVRAELLESLPFRDPSRLARVYETFTRGTEKILGTANPPNYFELRAHKQVFDDVAAYMPSTGFLGDVATPERLRGVRVTANLFGLLGVRPLAGRLFDASDDGAAGAAVVVVSEGLWRRAFAADPHLIGSQITFNGAKRTVVGVIAEQFDFPISTTHNDFWIPLDFQQFGGPNQRGNHSFSLVARLAAGVDSVRATAAMDALAKRLLADFPESQHGRGLAVVGLAGNIVGKLRPALLVLLGAVGLVLLIACANVANLLLARAAGRRREIAVRTALGAERGRLVRQLLTESAMLSIAGGVLGILVARSSLNALLALAATTLPRADSIGLQSGVLLFALVVSLATGMLVGIVPALRASQADLREDLTDGAGRSSAGARRHRTLNALIVGEIALSLMLLVGAGLVIRSFIALIDIDPGFTSDHVLAFHTAAPPSGGSDSVRYAAFYGPLLERLRALPGVRAAGATSLLPIEDGQTDRYFNIIGRPVESDLSQRPDAEMRVVSSDYFRALGISVIAGREFSNTDDIAGQPVAIVNDELAKRYFSGESAIGKQIEWYGVPLTIVGVVRSIRQVGVDQAPHAEFYTAVSQAKLIGIGTMAFVVSTHGQPEALAASIREAVRFLGPQQPVYQLATMNQVISASLSSRRLVLVLLGIFAALAVLLSGAGVYGVMSYGVLQRTREIGVRMALGAQRSTVTSMVLGDVGKLTIAGVAIGLAGAMLLSRGLETLLYGVGTHDPITFVVVPVVIAFVAMLAGFVPAIRASRIDPLRAMRAE